MANQNYLLRLARGLAVAAALSVMAGVSRAGTLYLARLSGANENPPTAATFTGTGVLILNDAENQATITATHNISIPVTGGHIHRGIATVNGPVIFPFPAPTSPVGPLTWNIPAAEVDNLKNRGLYMNFHTAVNPGGAIRSTLVRALLAPAAATPAQVRLANVLDISAGYDADLDQILVQTNLADTATQTWTLGQLTAGTIYAPTRAQLDSLAAVSDGLFAYLDDLRASPVATGKKFNGFVRGGDGFGRRPTTANQVGASISRPFFSAGADYQFGPSTRLGLAFDHASERDSFRDGAGKSTAKTDAIQGYFAFDMGESGLRLDGSAAYGWSRIDTTRNLASLGRTATASPDGKVWGAALRASQPHSLSGAARLVPYLLLDLQKATLDGYSETGAGAIDLTVRGHDMWNSAFEAGTSLDYTTGANAGGITFRLQAGWHHLLVDGSGSTATWLAGSPLGFTTMFDGARRNTLRLEGSANITVGDGWLGALGYRGLLGSGGGTTSVIEARVTKKF
ncbi:MAG TPA: autotransporter domain-containing protein [Lacunisphaera sp.]|nr:autotransporter domain-containing protein [Lacunisphaera sp.]